MRTHMFRAIQWDKEFKFNSALHMVHLATNRQPTAQRAFICACIKHVMPKDIVGYEELHAFLTNIELGAVIGSAYLPPIVSLPIRCGRSLGCYWTYLAAKYEVWPLQQPLGPNSLTFPTLDWLDYVLRPHTITEEIYAAAYCACVPAIASSRALLLSMLYCAAVTVMTTVTNLQQHANWRLAALKDVLGNPFLAPPKVYDWKYNHTVQTMAKTIVKEDRFEDMPILADALEDAGCADDAILSHLRTPDTVHLPACWVLRALLKGQKL
jgi:hypothetical protein